MPPTAPAPPGPTLRLTQWADPNDQFRIELCLERDGQPRQTAESHFSFSLSARDRERLRWYLEDYLQTPFDPYPTMAAGVEVQMRDIGRDLFEKVFESSREARRLWDKLVDQLNETRIEIITDVRAATAIPWELLRDPQLDVPLALRARTFVRAQPNARQGAVRLGATRTLRILLVIARPRGEDDVPFRSVAMRLVTGLGARGDYQLDVLRPPTFAALSKRLRAAKAAGQPYHILHFDGHGVYMPNLAEAQLAAALKALGRHTMGSGPQPHGHLVFEHPQTLGQAELVDGVELGNLLVETGVPVLVLNACRSAHADNAAPAPAAEEQATPAADPHEQVAAYGSLAQAVMDAGVSSVVAMRYNVYVGTAAHFVGGLYEALAEGSTLGEAATRGRKALAADPRRQIAVPLPLQDWPVPVIYEAAPIALFAPRRADKFKLPTKKATPQRGDLDKHLPPRPGAGFVGRHETLLALDRAFDRDRVVLLHAYAGSGKTATAAEFARWYSQTGGVAGPVLYTSFERHKTLSDVLSQLGQLFEPVLAKQRIHWAALDEAQQRDLALQLLAQVPVLWIWDNVEPVAGFPAGTPSEWTAAEQAALRAFLAAARDTQAKFLLTSRRDEAAWLGDLPTRITVPPMPWQERTELARALASKANHTLADLEDWRPLLAFSAGNPMTLTVLMGQALRDGLRSKAQIEGYVALLRTGTAHFADDAEQGRTRSLAASLSYGFASAFTDAERAQLALLHFFQGFVDVDTLRVMGDTRFDWCLPAVRGLTREAGIALLNRAAEIGLLTAHNAGYYSIHPALPWFCNSLFITCYPTDEDQLASTRAFVEAVGFWGDYYHRQYNEGNRAVIRSLAAEEANLLHSWQLAQHQGWWDAVTGPMQGLRSLYGYTSRRGAWARLVAETVPNFVNSVDDGPLPDREKDWLLITGYRVDLAQESRRWAEAERLQRRAVDWLREQAAPFIALQSTDLTAAQRNTIRSLGVALHQLGQTLREQNSPSCVPFYEESTTLSRCIGDQALEAVAAFNLGHAYKDIIAILDLAQAEHWYRRSLDLWAEDDKMRRAQTIEGLGLVFYKRFREAIQADAPVEQVLEWASKAAQHYHKALDLIPFDTYDEIAKLHANLSSLYGGVGDLDRALAHANDAIRYFEVAENAYAAARKRHDIARNLAEASRFDEALLFAQAALRNFTAVQAVEDIKQTQNLIGWIKQQEAKGGTPT